MNATHVYRLEVRDVPEQTVGSIRGRVATSELDPWIADAIRELFVRFSHQHIHPTGMPFAIMPAPNGSEYVDVEVALPAIRRVLDRGRMTGRLVPPCRALTTVHPGPYENLPAAYRTLARVMEEQAIEPSGEPREVYVTNPLETSPEDFVTEVMWPVDVPRDWVLSTREVERPLPRL